MICDNLPKKKESEGRALTYKTHNLVRKLQTQSTMMALAGSFQLQGVQCTFDYIYYFVKCRKWQMEHK